jgi:hypothetical protein
LRILTGGLAGLALLAASQSGAEQAQQSSSACRLLQVAELETALKVKATAKPSGSRESVPGTMTLDACTVVLDGPGPREKTPVSLRIVTDLPMDGGKTVQIRNKVQASEPQWKTPGARLEQGTVGSAICLLTGRPSVASHTTCSIPRGSGYVELDVIGDVASLPSIQTVGALLVKAAARQ